jgi:hypothetical protein
MLQTDDCLVLLGMITVLPFLRGHFTKADIARLKKQIEFLEESFDEEEAAR